MTHVSITYTWIIVSLSKIGLKLSKNIYQIILISLMLIARIVYYNFVF